MKDRKFTVSVAAIARAGLLAKGMVYCLLGALLFMAGMHMGGHSEKEADKTGVFNLIYEMPGGPAALGIIALGLICYCIWRGAQTFADTEHKGTQAKGLAARARYLFSGLVYAALAAYAVKKLFSHASSATDNKQHMAQQLFNKPFGQWLTGLAALGFIAVGAYQLFYGLSEKYKNHTDKAGDARTKKILLRAGKIGYMARGIVWLLIGWLFIRAAVHANPAEAGDTSKAFDLLSRSDYGAYLTAMMAAGLICYGMFNFVRVRYERFD